jgi:serine/threonine protein kinase
VAVTAKRHPDLKVAGVRAFSYEELASATNNFSDENVIGQGGYGKVYRGNLDSGKQLVAIKRAQEGSLQGAHEFYTEIELLSRVHHRNLVILVGYCDDVGEQVCNLLVA